MLLLIKKKLSEVRNRNVKKTKCVRLPAAWQELLRAATALKKTKAAATADKKARNPTPKNKAAPSCSKSRTWSNAPHSTQATSHIHLISPADDEDEDEDEDAEGDNDLELVQLPKDAAPTPAINPRPMRTFVLTLSLQQPTPLDILKSIEALGNKRWTLWVTALDQQWAQRFATMEKRMQDIESQTDRNVASIGYIANTLANPTTARFASFAPPPTRPSAQGHPYGQIPGSWVLKLPGVPMLISHRTTTVSTVGRQWTTFWDQSKGPEPAGPGDTSASAVQPSGSHIRLSCIFSVV
ncbi:hypothetical protein DFH29DRAFT_1008972 [Suillus ampliporus]|nr:hypothetical protein DFH29DRAFT_1008972 [Suillus ampliporus]